MKIHQPLDPEPRRQFVAVNDDAARHAHQQNVNGDYGPDQIVNLKEQFVQPQALWMVAAIVAKPPLSLLTWSIAARDPTASPTQRKDEDELTKAIIVLASEYGRYGI